jgi:tetratricopeptide (TPR) repeat protein
MGSSLNAQSTNPLPSDADLPQELLKSLQEFRKLQNEMPELKLPSANNVPGEDPYQQRLRSIQQRMELIRSLVQQKQAAEEQARQKASQNSASSVNQASDAHSSQSHDEAEHTGDGHSAEHSEAPTAGTVPPAFPLPNLTANNEAANSSANASKAPKYVGETVVPSAVDPLELANSLFQTGNYDLALKTYLAVADKLDKPQDVIWTDYFIASCQRILGDLPAAEKGYRTLVESRRPTRPVEAARWWLDNVERRKSIAATLDELDASLKTVSEELKANGNKK